MNCKSPEGNKLIGLLNSYVLFNSVSRVRQDRRQSEVDPMSKVKEELAKLIQDQPEDSSPEEIVRELAFHLMVERGLADSDAGRVISNDEMARRIRSWQR